jgi:hypothetical protein
MPAASASESGHLTLDEQRVLDDALRLVPGQRNYYMVS